MRTCCSAAQECVWLRHPTSSNRPAEGASGMPNLPRRRLFSTLAAASTLAIASTGLAVAGGVTGSHADRVLTGRDCLGAVAPGSPQTLRQRVFESASATFGVPLSVLLGVSYLESRWDDHGASPSTPGGCGPMNLTDVDVAAAGDAKGDPSATGTPGRDRQPVSMHTADLAARLTGLPLARSRPRWPPCRVSRCRRCGGPWVCGRGRGSRTPRGRERRTTRTPLGPSRSSGRVGSRPGPRGPLPARRAR